MATSKPKASQAEVKEPKAETPEQVFYFVSDSSQLSFLRADGKIWFAFSPFVTLDPSRGEVVKGLLTVKDPEIYEFLKSSPSYGSEWAEVAYPPLRLSGGSVSIVTGAGLGRVPRSEADLKGARELGELEARYMEDGAFKSDTPASIITRIGALKQALNFN